LASPSSRSIAGSLDGSAERVAIGSPSAGADNPETILREPTVEELNRMIQGTNDFGELGYGGWCSPTADGKHVYSFTVHLLDTTHTLDSGKFPSRDT
jgi:phosphatidylethanolamine-binding protein (PEBP) family uncharacterized protein